MPVAQVEREGEKMKEAYPLSWPDGWVRTRPQDRTKMNAWKKTANFYRDALGKEMERMKVLNFVVSSNVPENARGALSGPDPLDPGVSVWWSVQGEEDFGWQDVLDIHEPVPTQERIMDAFKERAKIYHPDKGGDKQMWLALSDARDNAIRYINRATDQSFSFVIACDAFKSVANNMAAIVGTIQAIRKIERCGTSALLERAFKGFSALPQEASYVRSSGV
jgi:hypothetical protein